MLLTSHYIILQLYYFWKYTFFYLYVLRFLVLQRILPFHFFCIAHILGSYSVTLSFELIFINKKWPWIKYIRDKIVLTFLLFHVLWVHYCYNLLISFIMFWLFNFANTASVMAFVYDLKFYTFVYCIFVCLCVMLCWKQTAESCEYYFSHD